MTLHESHMEKIDNVNNANTFQEHRDKKQYLNDWRAGVKAAGEKLDFCGADLDQIDRGFSNRPMCCGVFSDWQPTAQPERKDSK